jgi:hypothetical protein
MTDLIALDGQVTDFLVMLKQAISVIPNLLH